MGRKVRSWTSRRRRGETRKKTRGTWPELIMVGDCRSSRRKDSIQSDGKKNNTSEENRKECKGKA